MLKGLYLKVAHPILLAAKGDSTGQPSRKEGSSAILQAPKGITTLIF